VKEQNGRAIAADDGVYDGAGRLDFLGAEAREKSRVDGQGFPLRLGRGTPGRTDGDAAGHEGRRAAQEIASVHVEAGLVSTAGLAHGRFLVHRSAAILARAALGWGGGMYDLPHTRLQRGTP
jgi:hypothetical protein